MGRPNSVESDYQNEWQRYYRLGTIAPLIVVSSPSSCQHTVGLIKPHDGRPSVFRNDSHHPVYISLLLPQVLGACVNELDSYQRRLNPDGASFFLFCIFQNRARSNQQKTELPRLSAECSGNAATWQRPQIYPENRREKVAHARARPLRSDSVVPLFPVVVGTINRFENRRINRLSRLQRLPKTRLGFPHILHCVIA